MARYICLYRAHQEFVVAIFPRDRSHPLKGVSWMPPTSHSDIVHMNTNWIPGHPHTGGLVVTVGSIFANSSGFEDSIKISWKGLHQLSNTGLRVRCKASRNISIRKAPILDWI